MGYRETKWFAYMNEEMRAMASESFQLLEHAQSPGMMETRFNDYGYVVFPMAKAYEGFLKKLLLDMKLIDRRQFFGDHFRIGRALNPNLPKRYRAGWVYGRLVEACRGEDLPNLMWEAWKAGRNRVFHYFPSKTEQIELTDAKRLVELLASAMERALEGCRL